VTNRHRLGNCQNLQQCFVTGNYHFIQLKRGWLLLQ
jgi:hypothetical protein